MLGNNLVATFFSTPGGKEAFIFVLDLRVQAAHEMIPARNVTLHLHPSIAQAEVLPPGKPGAQLFFDRAAANNQPPRPARYSVVDADQSQIEVTIETVGGGGGVIRVSATPGQEQSLSESLWATRGWDYTAASASMSSDGGMKVKSPREANHI